MTKKLLLTFVVLLIISGHVFSQEKERAKNAVTLQFGIIGAELSYERMFNRRFSILADVSYTTLIFVDEFTASVKGRWYPFKRAFYLDMGLGYTYGKGAIGMMADMVLGVVSFGYYFLREDYDRNFFRTSGFLIQGGLGWKIDIGKQDHFVLPIGMGVDVKIGEMPDFLPYIRIGVGYAF